MINKITTSDRWIPGGAEKAERIAYDDALGAEVWLMNSGKISIIAYSGKRTKHDAHYVVRSRERALQWSVEYMGKLQAAAQYKNQLQAEKKAKRAAGHKLTIGDVLISSWGYDQTNIDYYQVTRLIGQTMVEIRAIAEDSCGSDHHNMTGGSVPRPGHFIGEPMRKAVLTYDGQSVRITSFASATKIEQREVDGVKVWPIARWTAYARQRHGSGDDPRTHSDAIGARSIK